jgi:hypothetical protein
LIAEEVEGANSKEDEKILVFEERQIRKSCRVAYATSAPEEKFNDSSEIDENLKFMIALFNI